MIPYVGSSGVPPPNDPMFSGHVTVSAGNHVVKGLKFDGDKPTWNAPDSNEFRDALKNVLVSGGFISEDEFASVVEHRWKTIKRYENYIYYFHGEVDVNARQCAVCLGFFKRKDATKRQ